MADEADGTPGPAVDAQGRPVFDPTANVLQLVAAAIQRQDDLREADRVLRDRVSQHILDMATLRSAYEDRLREKESERLDAIRAVDVQAVQRAAEVAADAVQALAAQVPITADAVRTSLAQALDPIQRDVIALRQAQYEQQGQKSAASETKADSRADTSQVWIALGVVAAIFFGFVSMAVTIIIFTIGR